MFLLDFVQLPFFFLSENEVEALRPFLLSQAGVVLALLLDPVYDIPMSCYFKPLASDLGPEGSSLLAEFLAEELSRALPPEVVGLGDEEVNEDRERRREENGEVEGRRREDYQD